MDAVGDYLLLGLRLGRLVDGFVDSWFGDPALARQVDAEPAPVPARLAADARDLSAKLADSDLAPERGRFLAAQVRALARTARRLAGENVPFRAEVEDYFEVRIEPRDPDRYAAVHDRIAELLPGPGPVGDRLAAFAERDRIPPGKLTAAAEAISAQLRALVAARFGLPDGESVRYEAVTDRPWNAFNRYHGDFRSTISLNQDAVHGTSALPHLVTHEAYPGHHTEHGIKEARLVRGRGHPEQAIALVNTPQCLMAEGIGELALDAALGPGWGPWTAGVLRDVGLRLDGEFAEQLLGLTRQLLPARQDALILLHDRGADPEDVARFLRRTMLVDERRAGHMVRFLLDPLWRAYTVTYIEGARLVRAWLAARAPGQPAADRYARLLTEPLLPSTLLDELADGSPAPQPPVRTTPPSA